MEKDKQQSWAGMTVDFASTGLRGLAYSLVCLIPAIVSPIIKGARYVFDAFDSEDRE